MRPSASGGAAEIAIATRYLIFTGALRLKRERWATPRGVEREGIMRRMQRSVVITPTLARIVSLAGLALVLLLIFSLSAAADDVTREVERVVPFSFDGDVRA